MRATVDQSARGDFEDRIAPGCQVVEDVLSIGIRLRFLEQVAIRVKQTHDGSFDGPVVCFLAKAIAVTR